LIYRGSFSHKKEQLIWRNQPCDPIIVQIACHLCVTVFLTLFALNFATTVTSRKLNGTLVICDCYLPQKQVWMESPLNASVICWFWKSFLTKCLAISYWIENVCFLTK